MKNEKLSVILKLGLMIVVFLVVLLGGMLAWSMMGYLEVAILWAGGGTTSVLLAGALWDRRYPV